QALDREVESLRGRQEILQVSVHAQETARLTGEKDIEAAHRETERVLRHLETLETEGRQLEGEATTARQELAAREERMALVTARERDMEREMTALRSGLESDRAEEAAGGAQATACRGQLRTGLEAAASPAAVCARPE